MDGVYRTCLRVRNGYRTLVTKPEVKDALGTRGSQEIHCEVVDWIRVARDRLL
jgi:hypothetical protein